MAMMLLSLLLLVALIIGGVYLLARVIDQPHRLQPTPLGPNMTRQCLDERFASGEISPEEYDTIRKRMEG